MTDSFKYLPRISELILVMLFVWVVSDWLNPTEELEYVGLVQERKELAILLPEFTELLAAPLFGKVQKPLQSAMPIVKKISPVSQLTIQLWGTVVAEENSIAIISITATSKQLLFYVGETIQPSVKLHQVYADAIVVEHSGTMERVLLDKNNKLFSIQLIEPTSAVEHQSKPPFQRQMKRHELLRQLQNLPSLLTQARVTPRFVKGQFSGFIVSRIMPSSLYQLAGIQNGDIIIGINGKKITGSSKQTMGIYEKLKMATAFDIELMRAGKILNIQYAIITM